MSDIERLLTVLTENNLREADKYSDLLEIIRENVHQEVQMVAEVLKHVVDPIIARIEKLEDKVEKLEKNFE